MKSYKDRYEELKERRVGEETSRTYCDKILNEFWDKYTSGIGLDLGYAGYLPNIVPLFPETIGVTLDYPGYDGKTLPFANESQDYVYNSHVLEHIDDYKQAIQEWHRVTKVGGHIIITVPHRDLYEKKLNPPSHTHHATHARSPQTQTD